MECKGNLVNIEGEEYKYYSPSDGEMLEKFYVPDEFIFKKSWDHCKNCQLNKKEFVIGDDDAHLFVVNYYTQAVERLKEHHPSDYVMVMTDSKIENQKNLMLSVCGSPTVCLWDIGNKSLIKKKAKIHSTWASCIKFLKNTQLFATCASDRRVKLFDYHQFEEVKSFKEHKDWIMDMAYVWDRNLLLAAGKCQQLIGFDIRMKKKTLGVMTDIRVHAMFVKPERNLLVIGGINGKIYCTDIRKIESFNGSILYEKEIHGSPINRIIDSCSTKTMITCGNDKVIKNVSLETGEELFQISTKEEVFGAFVFDLGGDQSDLDLGERAEFLNSLSIDICQTIKLVLGRQKEMEMLKLLLVFQ